MSSTSESLAPSEICFTARTDVTVEPQDGKFVVNDPRKHSFTQLGMAEYIVFRCFDGKSTAQAIAERLKRERDVIVSPDQIARLRDRLHAKQLVLAPGETVKSEGAQIAEGSGIVSRLIMIELPFSWDPDVFLTRLYHRIKHLVFRPAFFVAFGGLLLLAGAVWIQSLDAIRLQADKLEVKSSFVLFYVCFAATFFVHEVAHGVVCKGFGGKVPKIGSFLYFFLVTFYTDVSSSWMFPSKLRRLLVLFAGSIANLAICALATLLWRITLQGSPLNQVCFALMTINALAASFTLFPLLRGDGYYILSTALDIPNLRQNARRYAGALLRRTFIDRRTELPRATDREALVYLWYAPVQVLFFLGFFGYVAVQTSAWLIDELAFLGFWIIVLVLLDRAGRPLLRLVPGALSLAAEALRLGLSQGPLALGALLTRPLRDAARWLARRWKLVALCTAPLALLGAVPYRLHISAPFEVISAAPVAVRAQTGGLVERYLVQTGQWVEPGQVVARLVDVELAQQRQIAAAALDEARAKLAELDAGYRREDRAQARAELDARVATTAHAAAELGRLQRMVEQQLVSGSSLDVAVAAHRTASAREGEARAELGRLTAGYRPEERDRECARVMRAEQELAALEQKLAWTEVRASGAGRVVTRPHELAQRVGMRVGPGDVLAEIAAPAQLVARLSVPEHLASDVAPEMPVTLRFIQDPGASYDARLDAIEPVVTVRSDDPDGSIGMLSSLAHLGGQVPLGATGVAKVEAGSQSILGLLLRRAHRAGWVTFWSWW